jgi:hypothetical protein
VVELLGTGIHRRENRIRRQKFSSHLRPVEE